MSKFWNRGKGSSKPSLFTRLISKLLKLLKSRIKIAALVAVAIIAGHSLSSTLSAQVAPDPPPPPSLKTLPVPEPTNLAEFVSDKTKAIVLGKSLFWDMQVGSDGIQSCASCHFHAGADSRSKHQLNPGLLRVNADGSPNPDRVFNPRGLNYQLKPNDYPFHKLTDPNNRSSTVIADSNDVSGSQGLFGFLFSNIFLRRSQEAGVPEQDPVFRVGNTNLLRVTARNTPSVINAVFNFRNFWDGRAQNDFNGVNAFGSRDQNAKVVKVGSSGNLQEVKISLKDSSLASQAVGPPVSDVEMSFKSRPFSQIGKKLLPLIPLGKQKVHREDSVLGTYSKDPLPGIRTKYRPLIQSAFQPQWWNSNRLITINANGKPTFSTAPGTPAPNSTTQFSQIEYNFPLFFGLAVQLYEATLVSNDTPYDRFMEGNPNALTEQQKRGLAIFLGQDERNGGGRCINCHSGSEFTDASVSKVTSKPLRRREGNIIDRGFNNIGVRPTFEDLGVGDNDPFGNPLSQARLAVQGKFNDPSLSPPLNSSDIVGADGGFKTPGLRNVELTAPYFHNGGQLTLRQTIDFYSRGGDFQPIFGRDGQIQPLATLNQNEEGKEALVGFLKALTDERVRYQKAPFDHPQLYVPNGHPGNGTAVTDDGTGKATVELRQIPPVGRNGGAPLQNFLAPSS